MRSARKTSIEGKYTSQASIKVGICCYFESRMRHQETRNISKARSDVLAEGLKFGMLLFRDLQTTIEKDFASLRTVSGFIWVAPVAYKKFQFLEWYVPRIL